MQTTVNIFTIVLANLIPIIGVIFWNWNVSDIVILYWFENVIVGAFNFIKMLLAQGDTYENKTELVDPYKINIVDFFARLFLAIFFLFHYGAFTFIHGIFVFTLFGKSSSFLTSNPFVILKYVAVLLLSYTISFIYNYLFKKRYKIERTSTLMSKPYSRIIVIHITIILMGFISFAIQIPVVVIAIFAVLKMIVELFWEEDKLVKESKNKH